MEKSTKHPIVQTLYLAGPMRGIPGDNRQAFMEAANLLRSYGYVVWNPVENDHYEGGFTFEKAMARDLPEVCKADAVAVLRGWDASQGALLETSVAWKLGKKVYCAWTLDEVQPPQPPKLPRESKPTNPKDIAAVGKLDLSLFPQTAIAYGALSMTEGAVKYGAYNYRAGGVLLSVYIGALLRHIAQFYNGEWSDLKTGVPHLASMIACPAIIADAHECGVLKDDRPPQVDLSRVLKELQVVSDNLKQLYPNGPGRFTEL